MDIKNCTAEELQKEIDRRENMEIPQPLKKPDLTKLKNVVVEYIGAVVNGSSIDSDYDHYIYEAAM